VRGAIVEWYPYPFLDADRIGYGGVAWRAAILFVGMIGAAAAVAAVGNRLHDRRHRAEGEALVPATPD